MSNKQALGGLIVKLPYHWQGNFDFSRNWGKSASAGGKQLSQAYTRALTTGQVDVLFDTLAFPLQPEFDSEGHSRCLAPSRSTATNYTAKFAGPPGFARLPGGLPVAQLGRASRRVRVGRYG